MSVAVRDASDLTNPPTAAFQYLSPQDTNTPYILFVHGWNQERWEKDRYAETAFKRLYWQGYHGRFGSFRWPTDYDFGGIGDSWNNPITDPRNFDNSELTAWRSAAGLLNKLNDLNTEYPGNVYVIAHSMGNIVTGEALRLAVTNQVVNTYVAMQGAVAAHAYDPTTTTRALVTILGISEDSGTPNRYAEYYTNGASCYFNSSTGAATYVNFYNTNDYALGASLWQFNQNLKPDGGSLPYPGYFYDSSSGFYRINGSTTTYLNFPTNTYEIFAYGDEARCYALGAQQNVGGKFSGNQVELDIAPYSFTEKHKYHSGEFRSDNAQRWQFWDQVLTQMQLK
jgi:pimeloyl-ACP methyl ester carboxylesterase